MKFSINRTFVVGITLTLLIFVTIVFFFFRQIKLANATADWVGHTQEIYFHTQKLLSIAIDNEIGSRSFLLTGREQFLAPLEKINKDIPIEINKLKQLIVDNPAQQLRIDSLFWYVTKRIAFSDSTIHMKNRAGLQAAIHLVSTDIGKAYMDKIRRLVSQMQEEENKLLERRKKNNAEALTAQNNVFSVILFVMLILLVLLIRKERLEFRKRIKSEIMFRGLLESAPDAMVIVNEKGLIVLINHQTESVFGYDRNELIGQPVELLIPENLSIRHIQHRKKFSIEPKVRSMGEGIELQAVKKGGLRFPVEISLSPLKTEEGLLVSASIRDITERKKAEEQITYMTRMMEDTSEAVFSTDEHFITRTWNKAAELLYGFSAQEAIGRPIDDIIRPQLSQELKEAGTWKGEIVHLKKDGSQLVLLISITVFRNPHGEIDGYISVCRDISERKKLEKQLKKTNADLEAFTYSVSHDLRAPLRGIIGFTAMLEEDYTSKLDDEAKRITSVIKSNTLKMGHLIDDLLTFSRMGKQEFIKTNINSSQMVNEVINNLYTRNHGRNIEWVVQPLPNIKGDLNTIRQVWINFISNAIKYSGNKEKPHIEIGSFPHDGQTAFFIKDNGVGFDNLYRDKLFKVFQRLHSAEEFEGTGVGLAIAEKIISRHEGNVWAEAEVDKGASFYFSLPVN